MLIRETRGKLFIWIENVSNFISFTTEITSQIQLFPAKFKTQILLNFEYFNFESAYIDTLRLNDIMKRWYMLPKISSNGIVYYNVCYILRTFLKINLLVTVLVNWLSPKFEILYKVYQKVYWYENTCRSCNVMYVTVQIGPLWLDTSTFYSTDKFPRWDLKLRMVYGDFNMNFEIWNKAQTCLCRCILLPF